MVLSSDEPTLDDRIVHVRTLIAECSVLLDELEQALTAVERVFPPVPSSSRVVASFYGW